jgi:hypothetical protein
MSLLRVWFAVDVSLDNSPPLASLRQFQGPTADVYFYRACAFCKLYARAGALRELWPAVAGFVRWPDSWEDLRDLWRRAGLVFGPEDELYQWMGTNGWMLAKQAAEAKRSAQNRKAARLGAKKRRAARAQTKATSNGRLVGG